MKAPAIALLVVALAACSHDQRLHTAMVGLQTSADAFVAFDKATQAAIVARASSETQGIAQLAAYRAKRAPVETAFAVAFRSIAIAAVIGEDEARLTNALLFAAEAVRAFDALRGVAMNPAVLWAIIGEGLKAVETLLHHGTPEAVGRAKDLVTHLIEGHSGRLLPEDVAQALEDMRAEIAANDDEANAALRAKFGGARETDKPVGE